MNLCTDQLAMLLAAPGQLLSISHLAADPRSSAMADEAAHYPQNRGQAEQIYLLHPDLVLAGSYTALASVALLRRLGITVLQLPPVDRLADVAPQIRLVAEAMGRAEAGAALAEAFETELAGLAVDLPPATAALYYPNGFTTGAGTLADDVLHHTGFANIGAMAGVTGGGTLPLERLVMAAPQVVVTSKPYAGASRAEEILAHPALGALRHSAGIAATSDADWICGTPYLLRAVAAMAQMRKDVPDAAAATELGPEKDLP